jgi:hypothetical protein
VHERECFRAAVVGQRVAPDRDELLDVVLVDLGQRAVALAGISHAVDEDIARRLFVVLEIVG